MSSRETYHLPSVVLEMEFMGDESKDYDLKAFRSVLKEKLMKRLIADGVAFQEPKGPREWREGGGPLPRIEGLVDEWILGNKYRCSKSRDRHSGKIWWVLECQEQVSILMSPAEG